jgi:hypothetical protein
MALVKSNPTPQIDRLIALIFISTSVALLQMDDISILYCAIIF